jgi:UDP-N-acetylglucosamine--N-acetylmuramyl-(pentapeptide) pyrophosphoryl-undecaprenol N-acetylglucosamine transferase
VHLIVTGGGTGGHVYPALEVAELARRSGIEVRYLGSDRGQERAASAQRDIPFEGFASEPLYSLKSPGGWKALYRLMRASSAAKRRLRLLRPDAVFSTGGYSAAPVMAGARSLGIPYVILALDSIPGRTHRLFASRAAAFATVFRSTERHVAVPVVRTGLPIRTELREAAAGRVGERRVLVVGGSQGSAFLNGIAPQAAKVLAGRSIDWVHAAGRSKYEEVRDAHDWTTLQGYRLEPYLETNAMMEAYRGAGVALARSGSTLAEFALFRLPSVLVPFPTAADDHQFHNAKEFEEMGAATVIREGEATVEGVARAISDWLDDEERRDAASRALAEWDVPDAATRLLTLVQEAVR